MQEKEWIGFSDGQEVSGKVRKKTEANNTKKGKGRGRGVLTVFYMRCGECARA
jgi:hypothetical protein